MPPQRPLRTGSGPWSDRQLALAFVGRRVARLQQQLVDQVAQRADVTEAEATLLVALEVTDHDAGLTPSELTGMLLQTSGGTATAMRRLEQRELITRRPDPDDGRGRRVDLTAAGHEVARELVQAISELHADLLSGLDDDESARVFDALVVYLRQLERRSGQRSAADALAALAAGTQMR
jgi:DNA-binding MarR family transcriptional regulator